VSTAEWCTRFAQSELLSLVGKWGQLERGKGCVMRVDQGNGLHIVVKEPHKADSHFLFVVRTHHEPTTDATFTHLDHFMDSY
jgi:hypothetical protein